MQKNTDTEDLDLLISKYKTTGDKKNKKQLKDYIVLTCLPVVKTIAYSIARRSTDPVEDIIQIGCIGLVKAIDLYKPMPDKCFKSYAKILITGEIKHYLRDNSELIKSSRAMRELSYKINKITTELAEKLGRTPTDEEISEVLQIPQEQVKECYLQDRRTTVVSIDDNGGSDDNSYSLVEKIEDESAKQTIISYENRMLLDEIMSELEPLEHDLIISYYYEELTNLEMSLRYNIPQKQVAARLKYALDFVTKALSEKGIENLD